MSSDTDSPPTDPSDAESASENGIASDGAAAGGPTRLPPTTERDVLRRVVWILLIIGALAGIFFTGKAATTGLDATSDALPEHVDRLIPASGAQVLRQSQVGIDVADGYDGYLIVNGVEVRSEEDGLIRELGTGLILLQPGPGKAVEILNEGRNCIVAMVWNKLENRSSAAPVSWCFEAT